MKRLSFFMAIVVAFALIFTACEKAETGKNDKNENKTENKITIDTIGATYCYAMTIYNNGPIAPQFPGLSEFYYEAYTEGVVYDPESGDLEGNGLVVIVSQLVDYVNGNISKNQKIVPFVAENGAVTEVFPGGAVALTVYVVEDGAIVNAESVSTANFTAQFIGDDKKMTFAVEGNFDGGRLVYVFKGAPKTLNYSPFLKEDVEGDVFEGEEKYAQAEIIYYGKESAIYPLNVIEVVLIDAKQTAFADFYCYGSLDDEKNVYGTFKVADEHAVATMAKSPGFYVDQEGAYAYPSFIARNYTNNGADYYLVNGGSITIEKGKISFDLTSLNGSKITSNYEGNFEVLSYEEAYPSNAPQAKLPSLKNVKKAQPLNYNPIKLF